MESNNLLLKERHSVILQQLASEGRVLALALAKQLNVSEDTIRRDLRDLASAGLCSRVYGGALPVSPAAAPLAERRTQAAERKSVLARLAATLVGANSVVFIDAGSTNLAIAHALPPVPLTVITNAPSIAMVLLERPSLEVILIGGRLDVRTGASLGANALRDASQIRPDLYFLGACGVDAAAGITNFNYDEAEFKRSLAALSKAVAIAATSEKFGTAATYAVLPAAQVTHLIAEHDADHQQTEAFTSKGTQLLRAAAD